MFGTNGYGSQSCYNMVNERIDEAYTEISQGYKDTGKYVTPDEILEEAIRRSIVIEDDSQVKYYVADYKSWAARKAFGGM